MAYTGFNQLKGQLAQRPDVADPAGLAASIGRKKYGKKTMAHAAAKGQSLKGAKPQDKRAQMIAQFIQQRHA